MLHKRVMGAAGATVAVGALVLAGLQGAAFGSDSPGTPDSASGQYSPGLLKAMQRDLGLTPSQAKTRLANESEAGAVAGTLRLSLGRSYGGAWVSGKTSADVVVATTDAAEARRITDEGARAKVVDHSLAALDAAKADLDRVAHRSSPAHVPVWYVDTAVNRVVLHTSRPAAAERFAAAAGVDESLLTIRRSHEKPRTYADVVGGDAYYIGSGGRCSVGFSVTRGGGQEGFVTAGHCGRTGQTTTGVNRQAQGSFQGSTFPGRDYAWVGVNSQWNATPTVNGYGTGTKQVEGSTEAVERASVCRSGSTTGWHCGTIQQRNTSVTYPQGTVSPVTRTNVCAEPGDSGGSFISGTQAQGMTSGGSGNCRSGGTTYFQPVNAALQVYGLTLTTTDDGGTDPPTDPPGGTWAAGTVYQAGDTVTYGGTSYRCLQSHQALPGWEPPNVPALWQAV